MRRKYCLFSSLIVLAAGAAGIAAPSAVQETSSVSLIEVPVTVLGKDDKPVRGLTAADFEVRDEGKLVKVESVDVSESPIGPGASAETKSPVPAARHRFLLLFDLSYSTPSEILRVREAALDFVQKRIGPDDLVSVFTFSVDHGFNLVVNFTTDRQQLAWAVRTLGINVKNERSPDPLQLTASLAFGDNSSADSTNAGNKPGTVGGKDSEFEQNLRDLSTVYHHEDDAYRRGRVTKLLQSFGNLARALDSVEGRKHVILFSLGFDMRLLQGDAVDSQASMDQSESALHGSYWKVDSQQRFGNSGLQSSLNTVVDLFKRSDCVVHSVDLAGLKAQNDPTDPSGGQGQDALYALSNGTGGELYKNANSFSEQLDRLLEQQSVTYVLTFAPRPTGHSGMFHALKVKVRRSGARVSARAGYFEPRPYASVTSAEKKLTAADIVASDIPTSGIRFGVVSTTFSSGRGAAVPVLVQIPVEEIAPKAAGGKIPIEVYVYAFDAHGGISDFSSQLMTLDLAQVRSRLDAGGFLYYAELRLPPGDFRLKTLVRNGDSGASGLSVEPLHVPDYSQKKPSLQPPLAVGSSTRGLLVRGHSVRSGTGYSELNPYLSGADAFLPEAAPSVAPEAALRFCLYADNFDSPQNAGKLRLEGEVVGQDGKLIGKATVALASRSRQDSSGRVSYLVDFKPESLPRGKYALRLLLQDPVSGTAGQATSPFEVR